MGQYDNQLLAHLDELKEKTIQATQDGVSNKVLGEIKDLLDSAPEGIKGRLFEKYIELLYKGNGFIAEHVGGKGDNGADVVLRNPNNLSKVEVIVQAKNQRKPLTFKEVRSELIQFENEGSQKYNCYQYTLISINGFVKSCEKLKQYNMRMESWDYVEKLIIAFRGNYETKKSKQTPRFELRAHNQTAYQEIKESLKSQDKLAVVRATGTGKSFLITELLKDYEDEKKLVVAPSHYILNDLKKKFFLRDENTTYLTYQKINRMVQSEFSKLNLKLIIFDEFHRLGADKWGDSCRRLISHNQGAKVLGFSATPIRFLDNSRDMVWEYFEGNQISELSLGTAIMKHILPSPIYVSSIYTMKEESQYYEEKIKESSIQQNEKQSLLNQLNEITVNWEEAYGVDKILEKYLPNTQENLKFIVFCETIEHLNLMDIEVQRWFKQALNKRGSSIFKDIRPYRIHSKVANGKEILKEFVENKAPHTIDLLFSVNMFNEGIHVEGISGVILLRETASPNIYYQQIGRALAVGNENPLIFDLVNNFQNLKANDCNFGRIVNKAKNEELNRRKELGLPQNTPDVVVVDYLEDCEKLFETIKKQLRKGWHFRYEQMVDYIAKKKTSLIPINDSNNHDLRIWAQQQRRLYSINQLDEKKIFLLNQIKFDWNPEDTYWNKKYKQYQRLLSKGTYFNIYCNKELTEWVMTQRAEYRKGILSEERIDLLNKLNFYWETLDKQWIDRYKALRDRKQGVLLSAYTYASDGLKQWEELQSVRYKDGKLSPEKIYLLNQLGFDWNLSETEWWNKYNQLEKFFKENGHSNVFENQKDNGLLIKWIREQRRRYKKDKLSEEKIEALNKLKVDLDPLNPNWIKQYERLVEFFKEYGHSIVPTTYTTSKVLINWSNNQRIAYVHEKLTKKEISLLNELEFCWDKKEAKWLESYYELRENFNIHGCIDIPKSNKEMLSWITDQRKDYKQGTLSENRVVLLNELKFDWDPEETEWNHRYQQLAEFFKVNGHVTVYSENKELQKWIDSQKRHYKQGKLSQARIELLNKVEFKWPVVEANVDKKPLNENSQESRWNEKYDHLKEFYKANGHSNVSGSYKPKYLGTWVFNQREAYKKGLLTEEQVELLNLLNFDWDPLETIWQNKYCQMKEFFAIHNHCELPAKSKEYAPLRLWALNQKKAFKRDNLSPEKIDLLNKLNFDWRD